MSQKLYILDTNVLLSDPHAVLKFEEHNVAIPMTVLEELDRQKSSDRDVARDARAVIRTLDSIIRDMDAIEDGVEMNSGGRLFVLPNIGVPEAIKVTCPDDEIINATIHQQELAESSEAFKGSPVLVTNDVCMRLKARGAGVRQVQEYRNDVVVQDPDLLPRGYFEVPDGWLSTVGNDDVISKSCGRTLIKTSVIEELLGDEPFGINDWLINEEDGIFAQLEGPVEGDSRYEDGMYLEFTFVNAGQFMNRKASGIVPKDFYQAIALDALLDPELDIVIINGAAGSGKTLLAMAAAVEMVKGKRGYRHYDVIVSRSMHSQFDDIGFLPGNESEKTKPWLSGVTDNLEHLARVTKNMKLHPNNSIVSATDTPTDEQGGDAFIQAKALNFMRGRSIVHKVFIIDEIQNLTQSQVKTIISRAGEYCKVVLMGSLNQIDSPIVTPRTSALACTTEKFHGEPFAKVITLGGVHRSRLAKFADEHL